MKLLSLMFGSTKKPWTERSNSLILLTNSQSANGEQDAQINCEWFLVT
jgi:hypothetical protein